MTAQQPQLRLPSLLAFLIKMTDSGVFGAIGAVLGYIGADAATKRIIERLLWPQRSYSNFTLKSVPLQALLMPMNGPLHTVCLEVFDSFFNHGLFKGRRAGHMLGTSFYPSLDWTYTIWDANGVEIETEELRNGLWVQALCRIPIPSQLLDSKLSLAGITEKSTRTALPAVRAMTAVSHINMAKATDSDKESNLPFVYEEVKTPTLSMFVAIFTAEATGILVAVGLLAAHQSLWAIWWFVPLILRLLSALFALHREGVCEPLIDDSEGDSPHEALYNFEIHCPQSDGNFMLFSGPRSVVDQFFIHYGHPLRNRFREIVQLVIIVLFGAIFPFGLFFSVIWMPRTIQYVWLCYQLYVVLTMIVARYLNSWSNTTTEVSIAEQLGRHLSMGKGNTSQQPAAILFGQVRNGSGTIKASLSITYHNQYHEGKAHMDRLLHRSG